MVNVTRGEMKVFNKFIFFRYKKQRCDMIICSEISELLLNCFIFK